MKYALFNNIEDAEAYKEIIQEDTDAKNLPGPKVIYLINIINGRPTVTLLDDNYPEVLNGEVVESIEPEVAVE